MNDISILLEIIRSLGGSASLPEICDRYTKRYHVVLSSNHKAVIRQTLENSNLVSFKDNVWKINGTESIVRSEKEWILSANPKKYDHVGSFMKNGYIDWRQHNNFEIGDIVYVYTSKNVHRINAIGKVAATNMGRDDVTNDTEFWKDGINGNQNIKRFFRLQLIRFIDDDRLELAELKKHGLSNAPEVACTVNGELADYIHYVIDNAGNNPD